MCLSPFDRANTPCPIVIPPFRNIEEYKYGVGSQARQSKEGFIYPLPRRGRARPSTKMSEGFNQVGIDFECANTSRTLHAIGPRRILT
jgi:hypothetical protein